MSFLNKTENGQQLWQKYQCSFIKTTSKSGLECDTENTPIKSTIYSLHLSPGSSSMNDLSSLLFVKMKNWRNNYTLVETPSSSNENITADSNAIIIDFNSSYSSLKKSLDNKKAPIQLMRFANYKREGDKKQIKFNTYFYFFNKTIPKNIFYRLRIHYLKNLRNLEQEMNAESVPTLCAIKNESLADTEGNGNITEYECTVTTLTDKDLEEVILNTDIDLIEEDKEGNKKSYNFSNINFNGNSSEDANNLKNILELNNSGILEDSEIELPVKRNYFRINGTLNPSNLLTEGEKIQITFLNEVDNIKNPKTFQCSVNKITPQCLLECDTQNQAIKSTIQDMHLSDGASDSRNILFIKMKDWDTKDTVIETPIAYNRIKKSSDKLSKGAIIAIIIASVALLVGATTASIILYNKKRTPELVTKINESNVIKSDSNSKIVP